MRIIGSGYFLVLLTALLVFPNGCKPSADQNPANYPSALIVMVGAESVKYYKSSGVDQISYELNVDYPAFQEIDELTKNLYAQGWQPLKEDFLNQGIPTSIVSGWDKYEDGTKSPPKTVHSWITDWSNKNEDVVRYSLRYEYTRGKDKDLKRLKVSGMYIPADLQKRAKNQASNYQK